MFSLLFCSFLTSEFFILNPPLVAADETWMTAGFSSPPLLFPDPLYPLYFRSFCLRFTEPFNLGDRHSLLVVQLLERDLRCHRLELQAHDLQLHNKHMVDLTALQDQEHKRLQK